MRSAHRYCRDSPVIVVSAWLQFFEGVSEDRTTLSRDEQSRVWGSKLSAFFSRCKPLPVSRPIAHLVDYECVCLRKGLHEPYVGINRHKSFCSSRNRLIQTRQQSSDRADAASVVRHK
jgi:hypothetical protein